MRLRSVVLALALMAPLPAAAHNVISDVFPSGSAIEGEVGFSNGEMAIDLLIEVFDRDRWGVNRGGSWWGRV